MPIPRSYLLFIVDKIIYTHLQRQYSVTEDKYKKVAGDLLPFLKCL